MKGETDRVRETIKQCTGKIEKCIDLHVHVHTLKALQIQYSPTGLLVETITVVTFPLPYALLATTVSE